MIYLKDYQKEGDKVYVLAFCKRFDLFYSDYIQKDILYVMVGVSDPSARAQSRRFWIRRDHI